MEAQLVDGQEPKLIRGVFDSQFVVVFVALEHFQDLDEQVEVRSLRVVRRAQLAQGSERGKVVCAVPRQVLNGPVLNLRENGSLKLIAEAVVLSHELVGAHPAIITAFDVVIGGREEKPAGVEGNVAVKLLLVLEALSRGSVHTDDVADAINLGAVFLAAAVEDAVNELLLFPRLGLVPGRVVALIHQLEGADPLVVRLVRQTCVHNHSIEVNLVVVNLNFVQSLVHALVARVLCADDALIRLFRVCAR